MMKAFLLEFYKARRRKVWLVVLAMIAVQALWSFWGISRMDAHDLEQGWLFCLYQFPLLNAIMMPVIAAVTASRLCDVEHKGQTFRLLGTVIPAGRLFDAKFFCGAGYMLAAVVLQMILIIIAGFTAGFTGSLPLTMFGYYFLFTSAVSLTILLLQQALSLLIANQMVSLTVGLIGAFFGLFSLFFPQGFQKFVVWGYYGVLMFIRMDWNRTTRITNFYQVPVDWAGLILLGVQFLIIYIAGRALFARKEL
jgi:hypothetical protein